MTRHELPGAHDEDRSVWWEPAADGARVLVLLDGEYYRDHIPTAEIVANVVNAGVPPFGVLYVDLGERETRWRDTMCSEPFARFLATDVPAWIESRIGGAPDLRIGGLSLSGLQAAFTAAMFPAVFPRAFAQSPSFWWADDTMFPSAGNLSGLGLYVSCGLDETAENVDHGHGLVQERSQLDGCRDAVVGFRERGATVTYEEIPGGHDFDTWTRDLPACLSYVWPNA